MLDLRVEFSERPLLSAEQIVAESIFVGTLRLANYFGGDSETLFKEHGLTSAQYNALRILRDAPKEGLSCQHIGASMIQKDPDVTRLTDRMEESGWVVKERAKNDRRVVLVRLTEKGSQLVNDLDRPVVMSHIEGLSVLTESEKKQFLGLLQKLLDDRAPNKSLLSP